MIQGLSLNANRLLTVLGQQEARNVNADFFQPEHILIALVRNKVGKGYAVLQQLNIDMLNLQVIVEKNIPVKNGITTLTEIPPSRRIKTIIDLAAIESRTMRQSLIGTEHIIIGLAREENSLLANFLIKNNIFLEDLRRTVTKLYMQNSWINSSSQNQEPKSKHTALMEFGKNLTDTVRDGLIDPIIGREKEIKRLIQILSRRTKNNPVLVGDPGIGKTSIVEGLAYAIINENVPRNLLSKKIIALDLASVIAGTKYRGQFEERIKQIINEIQENKNIILFIDELHTLIGTGGSQGAMDAANILKPALARGEIQCIGATTIDEYRKNFQNDAALERRFQMVSVKEPSEEETFEILCGIKHKYEEHHHVFYDKNIIQKTIEYAKRYIPDRFFPDKAIDIIDEAGAMKKISCDKRPVELSQIEERIRHLIGEKQELVELQNYEKAALVRDEVLALKNELIEIKTRWENLSDFPTSIIEEDDITEVISAMTDIPINKLNSDELKRILNIEEELKRSVIGQDEAVSVLSNSIRRSKAGISSPERPIGSFLLLGPTGVGKTLLAKTLAEFLFGSKDALIRVDMSDYMEKHNAARLVGAPPGYIGFENGGFLTEKIRRNPYSVLLLDEIEKAHPDVFNMLLQVLEEGELRDSRGYAVNFKNTVIIMTSNAGSKLIIKEQQLGFNPTGSGVLPYSEIKANAENEIKRFLSPEFINRIDDILVFKPLDEEDIKQILNIELNKFKKRIEKKHLFIELSESAENYFIKNGYAPSYGARPMRRLLQTKLEDELSLKIISEEFYPESTAFIDTKDDNITIEIHPPEPSENTETEITVKNISECKANSD